MSLRILTQSNANWVRSGYGVTTANLVNIFKSIGHEVGIFASYGLEGGVKEIDGFMFYPRGNDIWGNDIVWSHVKAFGADILITNVDTHVLQKYGNSYKPWIPIVPIMEDPLTPSTRGSLHGAYSLISISNYGQQILKDGGYSSTMIPLPVDTGKFYPLNNRESKKALGFPEDCYLIVNVGMNRSTRKGHDLLLQAMVNVLSEIPNAYLYIHTDPNQPDGLPLVGLVNRLGISNYVRFAPRYEYFTGEFDTEWMQMLYSAADVYVQPSSNEGQGMPVWESASVGCPVIATECTALNEFLRGAEGIGIPPINRVLQTSEGYAYQISTESIAYAIIEAYKKWGTGYVSAINRQWAIENVSLPVVGHKWQDFLLAIEKKVKYAPGAKPFGEKTLIQNNQGTLEVSPSIPRIASVATIERNCGIGQYTKALNIGLSEAAEVSLIDIRNLDPDAVGNADLVHVQHEPSIEPPNLEAAMRLWKTQGRKVAVTYHNINPQVVARHINEGLTDKAIIHWPPIGHSIPNDPRIVILGGMGCPTFEAPKWSLRKSYRENKFNYDSDDIVISTFGFAALGRGHAEVPREMVGYLKANPKLKFQIITPGNFLNDLGLRYVTTELTELVEKHGIGPQIKFITDFVPDNEVLERLWCSDVGFMYLGLDTLSSSSAIRFFISARLPTVVTVSTHFADVRNGVVVTSSGMSEFCGAIMDLTYDRAKRVRLAKEHTETYDRWKWPAFAERILLIYKDILGR